jgi:hypothetical protein
MSGEADSKQRILELDDLLAMSTPTFMARGELGACGGNIVSETACIWTGMYWLSQDFWHLSSIAEIVIKGL